MRCSKGELAFGQWLFQHRYFMPFFFATLFVPAFDHFKLLQRQPLQQLQWELLCLGISLLGLSIRMMTVAFIAESSSGRELSTPKAEHLNTTGIYSLVRHPLYIGNSVIWLGVASMMHLWWLSLAIMLISLLYHRLIICAEECYLKNRFGQVYVEWAQNTPVLIPDLRNWAAPELPFSAAMIVRREYSGLFQVVAVFTLMNAVLNYVARGVWVVDPVFRYLFLTVSVICAAIWYIVKRTSVLPAPDRSLAMERVMSRDSFHDKEGVVHGRNHKTDLLKTPEDG